MTRALVLALCLVSTGAFAQTSEQDISGDNASIENRGTGVPTSNSGDVAGASDHAMTNRKSDIGDRRTLDDLKAGTSGSTQTR